MDGPGAGRRPQEAVAIFFGVARICGEGVDIGPWTFLGPKTDQIFELHATVATRMAPKDRKPRYSSLDVVVVIVLRVVVVVGPDIRGKNGGIENSISSEVAGCLGP